jgi:hypothetical protein
MAGKVVAYEIKVLGQEEAIRNAEDLKRVQKAIADEIKRADFGSTKYRELAQEQGKVRAVSKQMRDEVKRAQNEFVASGKAAGVAAGSYKALQAQLKALEDEYFSLGDTAEDTARKLDIRGDINNLRGQLRSIRSEVGRNGLEGAFSNALSGIKGQFTELSNFIKGGFLVGAIQQVGQVFQQSITVFADFERQIQFLGAVSQATSEDLALLRTQAEELGATTQFSASQVAQLQIEYSKLGFGPSEILKTTADTLNLAAVAQSDLGETATVVGATIRAFGLDASETGRVTDVMAASFSSSALDLQKFSVAMAAVAPVADTAGVSLERTTALLGILVDRGLDASTAGTALRNIFLDLADKGLTFEEAMSQINNATDSNVAALDLFGKRGATVGAILAQTGDSVEALNQKLEESGGFAQTASDTITNDLRGTLDTLKSTVEATQIAFVDLVQEGVQFLARAIIATLRGLTAFFEFMKGLPEFVRENRVQIAALGVAILAFNAAQIKSNALLLIAQGRLLAQQAAQRGAALATSVMTAAQQGLNTALRANPIGIVITALALLAAGLKTAYDRSETFRATLDGLGAVASELFSILREAIGSFVEGFEALKSGDIKGSLEAFGRGLIETNPLNIAFGQGERLAKAYRDGYEKSINTPLDAPEPESGLGSPGKIEQDLSVLNDAIGETVGKTREAVGEVDNLATGSIAALQARAQELRNQINETGAGDVRLLSLTQDLSDIEQQIEQRQAQIDALKSDLSGAQQAGGLTFDENFFEQQKKNEEELRNLRAAAQEQYLAKQQEITDTNIRQIETRREREVNAILQTTQDREQAARQIADVEAQAELEILNERLRLAEVGSLEYLEITRQRIELERELEFDRIEQVRQKELEARQFITNSIGQISQAAFDIQSQNIDQNLNKQLEAIDEEYAARINAAEGNAELQAQLEEEQKQKEQQLEKEAAERRRQIAITEAIIQTALSVIEASPDPVRMTAAAIAGAIQLATIQAQTFATGGFTGFSSAAPDHTGQRPVGIVHEKEYVVPTKVLQSKQGAAHVRALEALRQRFGYPGAGSGIPAFASGGLTSQVAIPDSALGSLEVVVRLQPEDDFGTMIAEAVQQGAANGSQTGIRSGIREADREREARETLKRKTS